MQINIVFGGRIPSKKDGQMIRTNKRTGKSFVAPSKKHDAWKKAELLHLLAVKQTIKTAGVVLPLVAGNIYKTNITVYFPDRRKADIINKVETIQDILVDAGIIEDDNRFVLDYLVLKGGYDKENPRVEVQILLNNGV